MIKRYLFSVIYGTYITKDEFEFSNKHQKIRSKMLRSKVVNIKNSLFRHLEVE